MRVSVFSGRSDDSLGRVAAVEAAVATAAEHRANMLVLPAYALGSHEVDDTVLQRGAKETAMSILAEVGDNTFLYRPDRPRTCLLSQQFCTAADATHDKVRAVADAIREGSRTIEVGDKRVAVLLCGENNSLRNVRNERNTPIGRFSDIPWPLECYDVLVNPAHTSMGHWNLLHLRFAYFSQAGRVAVYCANNTHERWKSSLCVYRNGVKVLTGDLDEVIECPHRIEKDWRLVTLDV